MIYLPNAASPSRKGCIFDIWAHLSASHMRSAAHEKILRSFSKMHPLLTISTNVSISWDVFGVHTTRLPILLPLQERSVGSRFIPQHYLTVHTQGPLLSAFRNHVIF